MDATAWDERYAASELVWGAEPNRFVAAECADLAPGRVVDLACGEGRNAIWLATRGWTADGIDWSAVAIDKARRLAAHAGVADTTSFTCADLLDHVPARDAYDLVLLAYLQVPAAARELVFTRAAAAVAPGGTFLVVAHDGHNLADGHGGPQDASVLYEPGDVVACLDGLTVERADHVTRDVAGAPRPAIDCLVRARRPSACR
jgi:SAM-dependent methyltransferase